MKRLLVLSLLILAPLSVLGQSCFQSVNTWFCSDGSSVTRFGNSIVIHPPHSKQEEQQQRLPAITSAPKRAPFDEDKALQDINNRLAQDQEQFQVMALEDRLRTVEKQLQQQSTHPVLPHIAPIAPKGTSSLAISNEKQKADEARGVTYTTVENLAQNCKKMQKGFNAGMNIDAAVDAAFAKASCQGFIMGAIEAFRADETYKAASIVSPTELMQVITADVDQSKQEKDMAAAKFIRWYLVLSEARNLSEARKTK